MLRNYLMTALRNLARNRLYAGITILGLAVAFTAAILIGQFVRNELTYDHWIPGYERVYKIDNTLVQPGQPAAVADIGPPPLAAQIRSALPGAEAIARLEQAFPSVRAASEASGNNDQVFAWADPNIFKVLPLPVLAGNLDTALQEPDTVVITLAAARKYFHRDLPIGDTLLVQTTMPPPPGSSPLAPGTTAWRPMRVTAVLKDLPSNTNLVAQVFASSRSAYSALALRDARPPQYGGGDVFTYVRLKSGASPADLQRALDIATQPEAALLARFSPGSKWRFNPIPLGDVHLTPIGRTVVVPSRTGSRTVAYGMAGVGALIVLVAAINFVTLMTARAARRGVEVGVRKATGAQRTDLMAQFIGEALLQVALATLIAVALAEALIKPFDAFIQREVTLDFIRDPALAATVLAVAVVVGLVASIYPALVLSGFRPAAVLKGGPIRSGGSPAARAGLVVVQFAILVCLIATTATIYRQTQFALAQGLGAEDSKLLFVALAPCNSPFHQEARKLPGVTGAACSSYSALNMPGGTQLTTVQLGGGRKTTFAQGPVEYGFFELFGVRPLAGRTFQRDHGEDGVLANPMTDAMPTVIINQTAMRALGFTDPKAAIGRQLNWSRFRPGASAAGPPAGPPPAAPSTIVGVVPDMPMTVRTAADPTFYFVSPADSSFVDLRMSPQDVPGTLAAIRDTWKRTNPGQPFNSLWLSQFRLGQYFDLTVQGTTVAICAGLAVLIACLGLFALSAYTTERRTKEIGVRKAMGADTGSVVLLLLWQFTVPVLVATAIAIPLGFLAMSWWVRGFVYHAPLSVGIFVLAAVAGVAIAWLTVSWQSFAVARAKPAGALRYE
jgi:putative ABC transport system permease protein